MKSPILFVVFFLIFVSVHSQEQFSAFFDSNKYELTKEQSVKLSEWLSQHKEVKIVGVHGFCDEDGSVGFNDTLARKRIDNIFQLIKDKVKIRDDFKTRSFGEKHLLSANKAENRKVTLFYLEPKDLAREDEILGIKMQALMKPKKKIKYPSQIAVTNPNGTKSEFQLDTIFMTQVTEAKKGEMLKIDNLNFRINTFIVMPESRGKMYELLLVLQSNPNLKIDIQGHLCCMPVDRLDLSTQRAKAIRGFLVANGIDKSQLSYQGFGSSKPIFPIPEKDETERAANRRVEILIVEN